MLQGLQLQRTPPHPPPHHSRYYMNGKSRADLQIRIQFDLQTNLMKEETEEKELNRGLIERTRGWLSISSAKRTSYRGRGHPPLFLLPECIHFPQCKYQRFLLCFLRSCSRHPHPHPVLFPSCCLSMHSFTFLPSVRGSEFTLSSQTMADQSAGVPFHTYCYHIDRKNKDGRHGSFFSGCVGLSSCLGHEVPSLSITQIKPALWCKK